MKDPDLNQGSILGRLEQVFRNVLDQDDLVLTLDSAPDDVEGWTSLSHINLIAAAENEFGLRFGVREVVAAHNVGTLVQLIQSKSQDT